MVELLSVGGIRRDGVGNLLWVIWSCYAAMQLRSYAGMQEVPNSCARAGLHVAKYE